MLYEVATEVNLVQTCIDSPNRDALMANPARKLTSLLAIMILALLPLCGGCSSTTEPPQAGGASSENAAGADSEDTAAPAAKDAASDVEANAGAAGTTNEVVLDIDGLMAAQLPAGQLEQGWVRLFDGQSLFGWMTAGEADWRVEDGEIRVSSGERSYLCTSFPISDFELMVDFKCPADTNSGIFMRTQPQPEGVAVDCLELNIAPTDNPFPTGSFVGRKKLEPADLGPLDAEAWHTYRVKVAGGNVEVHLDAKPVMELADVAVASTGYVSLQHNEGEIAFRNVMMRPIHAEEIALGENWEDAWEKTTKEGASLDVKATDGGLAIKGGLGQLQSKNDYGNFWLNAKYTLATPDVNSGLFFRCVRDAMLDGYECQVNHSVENGNAAIPADGGAGAIFRRQNARAVIGDGTQPTHVSLLANEDQILTWVNGVQVVDFSDTRKEDANPRRGLRTDPGPIAIQGHDPSTELVYHSITISPLSKP